MCHQLTLITKAAKCLFLTLDLKDGVKAPPAVSVFTCVWVSIFHRCWECSGQALSSRPRLWAAHRSYSGVSHCHLCHTRPPQAGPQTLGELLPVIQKNTHCHFTVFIMTEGSSESFQTDFQERNNNIVSYHHKCSWDSEAARVQISNVSFAEMLKTWKIMSLTAITVLPLRKPYLLVHL